MFATCVAFFKDSFVFDSVWLTMRLALPVAIFNVLASIPVALKLRQRFRDMKGGLARHALVRHPGFRRTSPKL
jgi:putative spermidine/putrescine transport system permease protein